jgi:ribosome-binding protein aMBF1 (putative translation factor)
MRCAICKRENDEVTLFEGILKTEMIRICKECADTEGVPLVKKPSEDQLQKADERYSVRERMEIMSGIRDTTEISEDQTITQGNLAKLRTPPKKQYHEDVLDNYYWEVNIARRRRKLSIKQLANLIKIDAKILQSIERGKIPENFNEIFLQLESFLGIKLLKNHQEKVNFTRTVDEEKEILSSVKKKISGEDSSEEDALLEELEEDAIKRRQETRDKIAKGEIDFSRREFLQNVTLNDLVEMKKERAKKQIRVKRKIQTDAILGDDLDLDVDIDEL